MRPSGRQIAESIDLPEATQAQVESIHDAGCRLTAEVLMNGKCSFCIEEPELGDFDQTICENGPAVPVALTEMIHRFTLSKFNDWREAMEEPEPGDAGKKSTAE